MSYSFLMYVLLVLLPDTWDRRSQTRRTSVLPSRCARRQLLMDSRAYSCSVRGRRPTSPAQTAERTEPAQPIIRRNFKLPGSWVLSLFSEAVLWNVKVTWTVRQRKRKRERKSKKEKEREREREREREEKFLPWFVAFPFFHFVHFDWHTVEVVAVADCTRGAAIGSFYWLVISLKINQYRLCR